MNGKSRNIKTYIVYCGYGILPGCQYSPESSYIYFCSVSVLYMLCCSWRTCLWLCTRIKTLLSTSTAKREDQRVGKTIVCNSARRGPSSPTRRGRAIIRHWHAQLNLPFYQVKRYNSCCCDRDMYACLIDISLLKSFKVLAISGATKLLKSSGTSKTVHC